MQYFKYFLNMIETAYSYMAAGGLSSYTVRYDDLWLTVSREFIEFGEGRELIFKMNRGYYQLSTIIELMIFGTEGGESHD